MPFPAKTNTGAILASAAEIIRTGGIGSLSMRTLAGRLGVRASSLYRHFPDRSSIERSLAVLAAEQLLQRMRRSAAGHTGERALSAAARAYLDYATAEPAFYELLMQSVSAVPPSTESSQAMWDFFVSLISALANLGDDRGGAAAFWSFLHGFTVLVRAGQIPESSVQQAFTRGTNALIRGLSVPDAGAAGSSS